MKNKDGGQAFPVRSEGYSDNPGMTLRDYFAGQALSGLATRDWLDDDFMAERAYMMAASMIKRKYHIDQANSQRSI